MALIELFSSVLFIVNRALGSGSASPLCSRNDVEIPWYDPQTQGYGETLTVHIIDPQNCSCMDFMARTNTALAPSRKDLGDVHLSTYLYSNRFTKVVYTNVNATFTNVTWKNMSMRFVVDGAGPIGVRCRNFVIQRKKLDSYDSSHSFNSTASLFWDCRWFDSSFEGRHMTLEYTATDGVLSKYQKFHFRLPTSTSYDRTSPQVKPWELLVYLEETNNVLVVHWQQPPLRWNVTKFRVNVSSCLNSSSKPSHIFHSEVMTLKNQFICSCRANCCVASVEPWLTPLLKWGLPSFSPPMFEVNHAQMPGWHIFGSFHLSLILLFSLAFVAAVLASIKYFSYTKTDRACSQAFFPHQQVKASSPRQFIYPLEENYDTPHFTSESSQDLDGNVNYFESLRRHSSMSNCPSLRSFLSDVDASNL